jgi:deoxyribose-phosphate aldolase
MKILEYGYYDLATNETETKELIKKALSFQPHSVSVLPYYVRTIRPIVFGRTELSCVIDYPFGLTESASRILSIEQAIKDGADIIELVMASPLLCNRKYDKLRKELEIYVSLCTQNNVRARCVLEYKIFAPELLYKAASILNEFDISVIYPSANFLIDNISDNILAGMLVHQKNPKTNIIFSGSAWTDEQIDMVLNNQQIYGYKTTNIYTLEKIYQKINKI